jgi:hypothetical protein
MMMHVNEPIPSPKSFVPELPDRIEHIIMKSTSKDLRKRYSQVSQFLRDLRSLSVEIRTAKFPSASLSQESLQKDVPPPNGEIPGSRDSEISLYFIDTGQLLNIGDGDEYTIGRRHKQQAIIPDIDLTPFKAYEWGISRLHAKISVIKGAVFISDHGSSNGTWIKGERLKPNSYYPVHHGMVVQLGKIRIQVLIYKSIFKKFNL